MVPRRERDEWAAEWTAELWHLCHTPHSELHDSSRTGPIAFSCGALHDAFSLRCDRVRPHALAPLRAGSAPRCLLALAAWILAGLLLCAGLTNARRAALPVPYRDARDLVVISPGGYAATQYPSLRLSDYQAWNINAGNLFSGIAFYQPVLRGVHLSGRHTARLSLAVASDNLLRMLQLSNLPDAALHDEAPGQARLFLTQSSWRKDYDRDPRVIGATAQVAGEPVRIAGIIPDSDWRLPGRVDAFLLKDDRALSELSPQTRGFVIARVRSSAFPIPRANRRCMTETRDGVTRSFECVSVMELDRQPYSVFLFALLLACLALPATTALPLGDYPARHGPARHAGSGRRWSLLAAKFLLAGCGVFIFSIDLAYALPGLDSATALYIQLATAFPALLFAFRWSLQDQRRRCPVCLCRLSNPARVGQASCNFLAWNGTELFCTKGHGLLHIPELPTSWFSTQRWLFLDPSWLCLFPESFTASPGVL